MKTDVEPLSMTVHSVTGPDLGSPALAVERQTRMGRVKMLLVLLVCAAPVIASYLTYYVIQPSGRTNYGELIQPTRGLPDLPLTNLEGQPVKSSTLKGQWLMVVVAPASCGPDCEKRLFLQRQLREMTGKQKDRLDKIWFVVDDGMPAAALRTAIAGPAPVQALRVPRDALAAWLQPDQGRQLEDHVYIVDPMGEWMMRFRSDPDPAKVKRDVERLLRASSSWHQANR
jgi:hypothetical protein